MQLKIVNTLGFEPATMVCQAGTLSTTPLQKIIEIYCINSNQFKEPGK